MLLGRFPSLISAALLSEYREVLLRPRVRSRHGLSEEEVDTVLVEVASNGIVREPGSSEAVGADPGDAHLWALLQEAERSFLVTGDRALLLESPPGLTAVEPAAAVHRLGLEGA